MNVVIISGPNTVGKGTVLDQIIKKSDSKVTKVIRYTSRSIGKNEINGVTYNFVSQIEFEEMLVRQEFGEFTNFKHGYYGTRLIDIIEIIRDGKTAILDLDVLSGVKLNALLSELGISSRRYFISPVSNEILLKDDGIELALEEIRRRILSRNRGFDVDESVIEHRLNVASEQLREHISYEHLVENSIENPAGAADSIVAEILNLNTELHHIY